MWYDGNKEETKFGDDPWMLADVNLKLMNLKTDDQKHSYDAYLFIFQTQQQNFFH